MVAERDNGAAAAAAEMTLLREHGSAIGRVCMALLGDNGAAQAATEEALMQAVDAQQARARSGELPQTGTGWLYGIVRSACAKRLEADPAPTTRRYGSNDGQQATEASRVRQALAELRPTEREPTVLRWIAELAIADIAEACRIDEDTARARVSRGLARLRASLNDAGSAPQDGREGRNE